MEERTDIDKEIQESLLPRTEVTFGSRKGTSPSRSDSLQVCPHCHCDFVNPISWWEISDSIWEVHLECANCLWSKQGVYHQAIVDRFDIELDRSAALVISDLQQITRSNMEEHIVNFIKALEADSIWPSDF